MKVENCRVPQVVKSNVFWLYFVRGVNSGPVWFAYRLRGVSKASPLLGNMQHHVNAPKTPYQTRRCCVANSTVRPQGSGPHRAGTAVQRRDLGAALSWTTARRRKPCPPQNKKRRPLSPYLRSRLLRWVRLFTISGEHVQHAQISRGASQQIDNFC